MQKGMQLLIIAILLKCMEAHMASFCPFFLFQNAVGERR
jgi:hypothetical protein